MRTISESALRNRAPIADALVDVLPIQADAPVIEVASGSGVHAAWFAARFPGRVFQPSERDPVDVHDLNDALVGLVNVRRAVVLDVVAPWPELAASAVIAINMIHASPPEVTPGLMRGAAGVLERGAPLVTYGPYRIGGRHTAPSNEAFDRWLKERDPRWGVRDLEEVVDQAAAHGLVFERRVGMPANNFLLVFRRS